MDFEEIRSESVECINLAVDMDDWSYVLGSVGLSCVDLVTWNIREHGAHIGVEGVEYLSCAASGDQADRT
jgi:hypothetical protein